MTENTERAQVGWGFWLWWVFASSVGLAVGFAVAGAVVGAVVGIAQGFILREQVSRAGWWVLASIVGLAVTWAALMTGAVGGVLGGAVGLAVGGAMALLGYGGITGGVLVWLLRQPITKEPSLPQDAA